MSANVTYLGEEDGPESVIMDGTIFTVDKPVAVSDALAIRLMGNPFFKSDNGLSKAVDAAEADKAIADKVVGADKAPSTLTISKAAK